VLTHPPGRPGGIVGHVQEVAKIGDEHLPEGSEHAWRWKMVAAACLH